MASVQVLILRSGRADVYGLPFIPGSVATVDRDYAVSLTSTGFASWMNPADAYDGETNIRKPSETYVLYQSGVPWWLPPGDGGANGLSFTGTRGVFTLSAAAPMAGLGSTVLSGGYMYLPSGAGGLATGGLYWFVMTNDTNGEVFAETYTSGKAVRVSSPTALPNLTAGRITQSTSEINLESFVMPGGSLGDNGISTFAFKWFTSSTAGVKSVRLRTGGGVAWFSGLTTTSSNDLTARSTRSNMASQSRQVGNRTGSGSGWDYLGATTYASDVTTVDTSVDVTFTVTVQVAVNTDSIVVIPMLFAVQYGA